MNLPKFFVLTLQLLLVDSVAFYLGHGTLVIKMSHGTINLWVEIVVMFEELELT